MKFNKKAILVAVTIAILGVGASIWTFGKPRCPGAHWLNFDVTCRVTDVRSDSTYLIEYFDPDTNDLRLYIRQGGKDIQIEHPYGKVKNFKNTVRDNEIKFNPRDDRTLLVNGEPFALTPK